MKRLLRNQNLRERVPHIRTFSPVPAQESVKNMRRWVTDAFTVAETSLERVAIPRAMPGEQRLSLAKRFCWSGRKVKAAGSRAQHPG